MRRALRIGGTILFTGLAVGYLVWKIDLGKTAEPYWITWLMTWSCAWSQGMSFPLCQMLAVGWMVMLAPNMRKLKYTVARVGLVCAARGMESTSMPGLGT